MIYKMEFLDTTSRDVEIIYVVQGDSARTLQFEPVDYTIPSGATATYYVKKPSGLSIYNTATISGNVITVPLTAQSLAESGENFLQVRIEKDGAILTSFSVVLNVKPFGGASAVESTSEANVFDQLVEHAKEEIATVLDTTLSLPDKAAEAKATGDTLKSSFAPAWEADTPYMAGDYVWYENRLYRRIADTNSAWGESNWKPERWEQVKTFSEIATMLTMIAPEFNRQTDYSTGDFVRHDRWLYRFVNDHSGVWDDEDVESVNLAGLIKTVTSQTWVATDPNDDGHVVITLGGS